MVLIGARGFGGGFKKVKMQEMYGKNKASFEDLLDPFFKAYAQNLILVTFLLVNFFGFLVITRHHDSSGGRH